MASPRATHRKVPVVGGKPAYGGGEADELRKLPDRYPDGPSHATMDAFADAWEAQQQEWSKHYKTDTDTILDLRKRLEAAEKKAADWEQVCRHLKAEK